MNESGAERADINPNRETVTAEMVSAAVDAYYGFTERDWEDDIEACLRGIVKAAMNAAPSECPGARGQQTLPSFGFQRE